MNVFKHAAALLPLSCLLAQAPPPAPKPAAQPAAPMTVTTEVIQPESGTLPNVPPDTVILSVGPEKLTAGEFARFIETLPENIRGQARGTARRQLAEGLIRIKL